jgi:hypothetical protein
MTFASLSTPDVASMAFFTFGVLQLGCSRHRLSERFMNTLVDVFSDKEVPFGVRNAKFDVNMPKTPKRRKMTPKTWDLENLPSKTGCFSIVSSRGRPP